MQCGIACLQMICAYYGIHFSIDYLSKKCFATAEGVSLLGINEASNKLGFHTVCGRVSLEQMKQAPLPCILYWNQNHFVVLYKIRRQKIFCIADPGKGLITCDAKELAEHWFCSQSDNMSKGVALFLQPTPPSMRNRRSVRKRSVPSHSSSVTFVNIAATSVKSFLAY